jgi:hypothetical protein
MWTFDLALALAAAGPRQPFEDRTHPSKMFGEARNYSLFLPPGYESGGKTYPVIYYFHGHSDRYTLEHYDKGADTVPKIAAFVAAREAIAYRPIIQTVANPGQTGHPWGSEFFSKQRIVGKIDHHRVKTPLEPAIEGVQVPPARPRRRHTVPAVELLLKNLVAHLLSAPDAFPLRRPADNSSSASRPAARGVGWLRHFQHGIHPR